MSIRINKEMAMAVRHRSEDGVWRKCRAKPGKCRLMDGTEVPEALHMDDSTMSIEEAEAKYQEAMEAKHERPMKLTRKGFSKNKEPKKVIIALDMDNTTVDFTAGFRNYLKKTEGLTSAQARRKYPEPTNYNFASGNKPWFKSTQDFLTAFKAAEETGLYANLRARNGAKKVIKDMMSDPRIELHVVTARSDKFASETLASMQRLGLTGLRLEHLEDKMDYPAHIFIDDKDSFVEKVRGGDYATDGIKKEVLVPRTGYNTHLGGTDWDGISQQLQQIVPTIYAQLNGEGNTATA